jgi:hypothetical protein
MNDRDLKTLSGLGKLMGRDKAEAFVDRLEKSAVSEYRRSLLHNRSDGKLVVRGGTLTFVANIEDVGQLSWDWGEFIKEAVDKFPMHELVLLRDGFEKGAAEMTKKILREKA